MVCQAVKQLDAAFWAGLKPRPKLTVDQHAEATLYLSERTSAIPGLISFDRTPYLREPMRRYTDPDVENITLACGTQVGKTIFLISILNYNVDHAPGPTMLLYPSRDMARSFSKERLQQFISDSPSFRRHLTGRSNDVTNLEYYFDRMTVRFAWNSMQTVSSHPNKYVLKDEVKDMDIEIMNAADDRTKTYYGRKIVQASSPLHVTDNVWRSLGLKRDYAAEEEAKALDKDKGLRLPLRRWISPPDNTTQVYFYHVPCPHCGVMIRLYFDRIRWPGDVPISKLTYRAWYECQECGEKIAETERRKLIPQGQWLTTNAPSNHLGFHLPSIYSTMGVATTFGEIVARYLRSRKTPEALKAVINGYFAWPYEEEEYGKDAVTVQSIVEAAREKDWVFRRNTLPQDVLLITAGADVHKSILYYSVWGWSADRRGFALAWGTLPVDMEYQPDDAHGKLLAVFQTPFTSEKLSKKILAAGVDSGWKAEDVYAWANQTKWFHPMKGERGEVRAVRSMEQYIRKTTRIEKMPDGKAIPGGVTLRILNTGLLKTEFYDNLNSGKYRLPVDADQDFVSQLASEKVVTRRNPRTGRTDTFFVKKRKSDDENLTTTRNHYLDTAIIARAMLEALCQGRTVTETAQHFGVNQTPPKESTPSGPRPGQQTVVTRAQDRYRRMKGKS